MKIKNPASRLQKFWGRVDMKHIGLITELLPDGNVLDIGCGYGSTTNYITHKIRNPERFHCIGIDNDAEIIHTAKMLYAPCSFYKRDANELVFREKSFNTIILKDCLHHLYVHPDFDTIKKGIYKASADNGLLIVFDPNVNFILRLLRFLSFHKDEECKFENARKTIQEMGYKIIHQNFNTLYSLPLSGGYVGIDFVGNNKFLQDFILSSESILERIINKMGLGRYLCLRYLIVAEKCS